MKRPMRPIAALLISALLAALAAGCARAPQPPPAAPSAPAAPARYSATFYPIYALALNVLSGVGEQPLSLMTQPQDGCPRAYELSEWDVSLIGSSDVILMGGRGFERFGATLEGVEGVAVVEMLADVRLIGQGEVISDEEASHWIGENPWAFLSIRGARDMAAQAALALSVLFPENADAYAANLSDFEARLDALSAEMEPLVAPARSVPVALMHEGLPYLADEWGLNVVARCEREPGTYFEGVELDDVLAALSDSGARAVLVERQAPDALCNALTDAGYALARIDTLMTGVADGDLRGYERRMLENARALSALAHAFGEPAETPAP